MLILIGGVLVWLNQPRQLRWDGLDQARGHVWLHSHYGLYAEPVIERDDPSSERLSRTWYTVLPLGHEMAEFLDRLAADYRAYDRIPASALPPMTEVENVPLVIRTTRFEWLSQMPAAVQLHMHSKYKLQGSLVQFADLTPYEQQIIRLSFPHLQEPAVLFESRWPWWLRWGVLLMSLGVLSLLLLVYHMLREQHLI